MRRRLAIVAPSALLCLIASAQMFLARAGDLSPWKGGGFGMFATLDHGAFRRLEVVAEGPDRSEELEIPPSLDALAARAATYPAHWLLRRLATQVAARERRHGRPITRVRIVVWNTTFDRVSLAASEHTLRSLDERP
jgi:hypothetical protein